MGALGKKLLDSNSLSYVIPKKIIIFMNGACNRAWQLLGHNYGV